MTTVDDEALDSLFEPFFGVGGKWVQFSVSEAICYKLKYPPAFWSILKCEFSGEDSIRIFSVPFGSFEESESHVSVACFGFRRRKINVISAFVFNSKTGEYHVIYEKEKRT